MITQSWLNACKTLALKPADFYGHDRKIFRGVQIDFTGKYDLALSRIGYRPQKVAQLRRLYKHQESYDIAVDMYKYFVKEKKYNSTSFHCYNHLLKPGATSPLQKKLTRGPCMQSVVLTHEPRSGDYVDVFYRTTELFKKFPADLIFLFEDLLPDFKLERLQTVRCHFSNVTLHPMYFPIAACASVDPVDFYFDSLELGDSFSKNSCKWSLKYLDNDSGILKFKQAIAVRDYVKSCLTDLQVKQIVKFCKGAL